MAADSEPAGPWTGLSGTIWSSASDGEPSVGAGDWIVQAVQANGAGRGGARRSGLWVRPKRPSGAADLERELRAIELLSAGESASPGLRLLDRLSGSPGGAVVERWQEDLESFWVRTLHEPEGFRLLCLAMADLCRRVADWSTVAAGSPEVARRPPRIRPRSVLRTQGGRWVLSGFGAPLPTELLSAGDEQGTEIMAATSHFQSPEELFLARNEHPLAASTWSIAESFLSLLKLRVLSLSTAGGSSVEMPTAGTDSPHLGSHRASLVEDLWRRKPALFTDRPLDPRQFLYPDRLPERDRRAVAEAIAGLLGGGQQLAEGRIERECLRLLDSALSIEPSRRYLDPLVLAGDFEGLARSFHEARVQILERVSRPRAEDRVAPALEDPTEETPFIDAETVVADLLGDEATVAEPHKRAEPTQGMDTQTISPAVLVDDQELGDPEHDEEEADEPPTAPPDSPTLKRAEPRTRPVREVHPPPTGPAPALPGWVLPGMVVLAGGQLLTLGLVLALWFRPAPPASGLVTGPTPALLGAALDAPNAGEAAPVAELALEEPAAEEPAAEEPAAEEPAAEEPAAAQPPAAQPPAAQPPAAQPSAPAARAVPAPVPAVEAPVAAPAPDAPARVSVSGAEARLRGPGGTVSPGTIEPGSWTVLVREGDSWVEAGTIQIEPGEQVSVKCGFGRCRKQ